MTDRASHPLQAFSDTNIAASLDSAHAQQLLLCDRLEAIADSLPDRVDRQACLHLARAIHPLVAGAHTMEEDLLFPALAARWGKVPGMMQTIERLKFEHFEDMGFAEELCDALMAIGQGDARLPPEALGYMLRGFFEGLRRHIAFEQDMLLPLLSLTRSAAPAGRGPAR